MFSFLVRRNARLFDKLILVILLMGVVLGRGMLFVARLFAYPYLRFESLFVAQVSDYTDKDDIEANKELRAWFRSFCTVTVVAAVFVLNCYLVWK